ncbi:MAG: amidohydrolase, partial [Muriicola sp.]|nr:amidohydrolase [Muriicola sp.]NNK35412.1 amidohydrolase [Eudoraea sp.]
MKKLFLLTSCLVISFISFGQSTQGDGPFSQLIIRGVTLINGNGAPPISPVDIVVENNIIKKIQVVGYPGVEIRESRRPQLAAGGRELDCSGMYLMPGFVDMHGHIGGNSQGADPDYVFKLWMGHGITTIREPSGRGVDFAMDLKMKSERNEIVAPRIFVYTGFGQGSSEEISTPEMAREWVRNNAKKGADGIKF